MRVTIAWSPGLTESTPAPTSVTTPATSCPYTAGTGPSHAPSTNDRSLWQTPHAATRTETSPSAGGSSSTFSTVSGWLNSLQTAAFTGGPEPPYEDHPPPQTPGSPAGSDACVAGPGAPPHPALAGIVVAPPAPSHRPSGTPACGPAAWSPSGSSGPLVTQ